MASYEMETSPAPDAQKDESKKISFRFCRECSNMLYPREDKYASKLLFSCRSCQYSEPAETTCIYRNSLKEEIAETAGNTKDVAEDPTVGDDSSTTPDFSAYDADMDMDEDDGGDDGDVVPQMCTLCGQEITCPFCGQPSDSGVVLETHDPADAVADTEKEQEQIEAERRERSLSSAGVLNTR